MATRADIQGLRAVASLLVATFHIWLGTVSGGVDVFFVVGGFLLATSLVGELERTGRIRVGSYLRRTATRLLPMAGLVLLVVALVLVATSPLIQFQRNAGDIFAAATYWENWRLAADSVDYVAAGHDKSAVQHFWAMSVQGQATLVLLAGMLIAWALTASARWSARTAAITVVGLITVTSFAVALVLVDAAPAPAYFSTWARLWEFGLGALVALASSRVLLGRGMRSALGALGLVLLLTAGALPSELPYPGLIALYPAGGAVLILLAGSGASAAPLSPLAWRPLVWLGGYSYGLYLWSWPVLKLYLAVFPGRDAGVPIIDGLLLLALSIVLSWASTRLLGRLARKPNPVAKVDSSAPRWRTAPRLVTSVTVPVVALASLWAVAAAPRIHEGAIAAETPQAVVEVDSDLDRAIAVALESPEPVRGTLLTGAEAVGAEWAVDGCLSVDESNLDDCVYGADADDAEAEIWIVGDSQAVTWAPGMRAAAGDGVRLQLAGQSMCPFSSGLALEQIGDLARGCEEHNAWVMDLLADRRPDAVVITYGAWWVGEAYAGIPWQVGATLGTGSRDYVEAIEDLGVEVVWLDAVPPAPSLDACVASTRVAQAEEACTQVLTAAQSRRAQQLARAMERAGATVVPTASWFCDVELRRCPLVVAGIPVHSDPTHIGRAYAEYLAPVLARELLLPLGVEARTTTGSTPYIAVPESPDREPRETP